ncbi:hypothetical protein [Jeotgalibacillus sp. R-1-5s-1]|nr:hypothetical protein [Jeotgalibacillus sp. R-1-5s-1]
MDKKAKVEKKEESKERTHPFDSFWDFRKQKAEAEKIEEIPENKKPFWW